MPLGQFKSQFGSDISAVLLEDINRRLGAASQALHSPHPSRMVHSTMHASLDVPSQGLACRHALTQLIRLTCTCNTCCRLRHRQPLARPQTQAQLQLRAQAASAGRLARRLRRPLSQRLASARCVHGAALRKCTL